jgi:ribosomal protein L29
VTATLSRNHAPRLPRSNAAPLEARIRKLEAELARERAAKKARPQPPPLRDVPVRKVRKRAPRAAEPVTPPQEAAPDIEALLAQLDALKVQLKGARTQIANLRVRLNAAIAQRDSKGTAMTKRLHREIRACLHPDRSVTESRLTKCFQEFEVLKITLVDKAD